jgi:hypothetical protein
MKKLIPKSFEPKNEEPTPRAGAQEPQATKTRPLSVKEKIAIGLANILTDEDIQKVVEVYRDGLKATQRIWQENTHRDEKGRLRGSWVEVPDWKTRKACADMIAAYKEGLPVQRQAILVQKFESMEETKERVTQSPEMLKVIAGLAASGVQVETGGQVIDIETLSVQKSGTENDGVA